MSGQESLDGSKARSWRPYWLESWLVLCGIFTSNTNRKTLAAKSEQDGHQLGGKSDNTNSLYTALGTRRSQRSLVIKNSSPHDSEADTDDMNLGGNYMNGPSRLVFKEVAVPLANPQSKLSRAPSPTSSATTDFSSHNVSNEYDTPGTSAAPTPTELDQYGKSLNLREQKIMTRTSRPLSTPSGSKTAPSAAKGKRKRVTSDTEEQLLNDELLAQALQKEEYGDDPLPTASGSRKRAVRIVDSEDDIDSLSSLSELDSEEMESDSFEFSPPKAKKARTSRKGVLLPARSLPLRDSNRGIRKVTAAEVQSEGLGDYASCEEDDLYYCLESDMDTSDMDESIDGEQSSRARTGTATHNGPSQPTANVIPTRPRVSGRRMRYGMSRVCYIKLES